MTREIPRGKELRNFRLSLGVTLVQVAAVSSVSLGTISRIELNEIVSELSRARVHRALQEIERVLARCGPLKDRNLLLTEVMRGRKSARSSRSRPFKPSAKSATA